MYSYSRASEESLKVGDIIFHHHELYVAGDNRGHQTATVTEVNPEKFPMIRLDNCDVL